MMTPQIAETLVNDHRDALMRAAATHRLRRRAAGVVVRTSAPAARIAGLFQRSPGERSVAHPAHSAHHSHTAHA